ncbi:hypothetical protein EG68_02735 [Paragonimus skrjabini miyazakii]|uniref:Uncharacterized protein n=1 Tax=Paragonimus skrjabini miyazakii TaxID=59628 RepID=A0A8S9YZ46_9TREM|nr:hypothetical protein EG68_02735 [Paragonimus skrjabini miyazakii]
MVLLVNSSQDNYRLSIIQPWLCTVGRACSKLTRLARSRSAPTEEVHSNPIAKKYTATTKPNLKGYSPGCPVNQRAKDLNGDWAKIMHEPHSISTDAHFSALKPDATGNYTDSDCQPLLLQIRKQVKQFCENTSIRGIPRIVSTKDTRHRILWVVFVAVFFVGCITCLTFIINQYLEFDVIHQPKKIYDSPRSFPSVTICNLRPFSTRDIRKLRAAGVAPVDMYINGIQRMRSYVRAEHKGLLSTLWSLAAYLSNLPESLDVQNLGHPLDDIMQSCFVLYKTGSVTRGTECERLGYWTKTQDQVFHNCYTYTVFENRSDTTLNMEMVIYLDNLVEQTDCFDCQGILSVLKVLLGIFEA